MILKKYKQLTISFLLALLFLAGSAAASYAQPRSRPSWWYPDLNWCDQNGFTYEYDVQGRRQIMLDYDLAMARSTELKLVIAKIAGMMGERGFPLKDLKPLCKASRTWRQKIW